MSACRDRDQIAADLLDSVGGNNPPIVGAVRSLRFLPLTRVYSGAGGVGVPPSRIRVPLLAVIL